MLSFDACYVKIRVGKIESDDFCKIIDCNDSFIKYFGFIDRFSSEHT